jgi:hypothetical protein
MDADTVGSAKVAGGEDADCAFGPRAGRDAIDFVLDRGESNGRRRPHAARAVAPERIVPYIARPALPRRSGIVEETLAFGSGYHPTNLGEGKEPPRFAQSCT